MVLESRGKDLTFRGLQADRDLWGSLPDKLRLRMRRALSWLERAKREKGDDDAAFIFYWIAFNAAYDREIRRDLKPYEQNRFSEYFDKILRLDSKNTVRNAIWGRFHGPIRVLLNNKFFFKQFWDYHSGFGRFSWESDFNRRGDLAHRAFAYEDTHFILTEVFNRLYVLRNQLIHGGATWNGSLNRSQVQDGARIMAFLVPMFIRLMAANPSEDWGSPRFAPV